MHDWVNTKFGSRLLYAEAELLREYSFYLTRPNTAVIGESCFYDAVDNSSAICVQQQLGDEKAHHMVVSRPDKLSIESNSQSTIYMPHVLSRTNNPHEVLREAYRALAPEGILILTNINPIGIYRLAQLGNALTLSKTSRPSLLSYLTVGDWLRLLGFEIFSWQPYYYALPFNFNIVLDYPGKKLLQKQLKLPWCHLCYAVVASKRVSTLTPLEAAERRGSIDEDILYET